MKKGVTKEGKRETRGNEYRKKYSQEEENELGITFNKF